MGQEQKSKQTETRDLTRTEKVTDLPDYNPQFRQGLQGLQGFQAGAVKPFSTTFDPIVQNAVSQGIQNINAQTNAAQRDLSSNLSTAGSGNNTALINVLGNLGRKTSALSTNALQPMALQQQREFDMADRQSNLAAGQNQANLLNILGGLVRGRAGSEVRETGEVKRKGRNIQGFSPFV